ncbi:MAG TPA: pitrilysin family protein [Thermoanaerobaculia bacterium]|nr:pitrilysin family protein [Thermoanaerobaculia bacterium]
MSVSFRIPLALLGLFFLTVLATPAIAAPPAQDDVFPFKVSDVKLDNGLRVVTIPYDSPGIVAYDLVVRTGSRDEVEAGHSGFAHFFEHMMFRGTERYSQDAYTALVKRMGANSNASTFDDGTIYRLVGPSRALETMMDIESDRIKNLKYDEESFRTESLAVLGEYNKNASNPYRAMNEKLRGLAFQNHTYKHTTMGFLADVKTMPEGYQYSLGFFNRFYRPENVTLLVVGDVKPETVEALARKYYGDWKQGYQPATIPAEPAQPEQRKAHIDWPTSLHPLAQLAWHTPAFSPGSVDSAALDLIAEELFGQTSPLYRELVVEKQWADDISGDSSPHRDPYLFEVTIQAKSDALMEKIQAAVDQKIEQLKKEPVDSQRLERIKSHLRYGYALGLSSAPSIARRAALTLAVSGDLQAINQLFAEYRKVTPADIQRVAREVFRPQSETIVTLSHPETKSQEGDHHE